MKRCHRCGDEKPLAEFGNRKGAPDGLQNLCKVCYRERQLEYRARKKVPGELDLSYDRDNREHEMPPLHELETELCERAACSGLSHLFLRPRFEYRTGLPQRCAEICAACPVFAQCRTVIDHIEDNAVTPELVAGYWAGETPKERIERRQLARVRLPNAAA